MLTYMLLSRMALWKALSPSQRRFVYQRFIHPMLIRWPMMCTKTILLVLVLLIGNRVGAYQSSLGAMTTILTSVLLGDVLELGLIAQRRQRITQFVHDHATEIQSTV